MSEDADGDLLHHEEDKQGQSGGITVQQGENKGRLGDFIRHRVQNLSEFRDLVKMSGDFAVQKVGDCGEHQE